MSSYKFPANTAPTDLSQFDMMAMVRGTASMDKHYFFNMVKPAAGDDLKLKEFLGGTIPKTEDGKRIPMNKQANNPSLVMPTVTGMKYFGQSALFKVAMDQMHAKKIGVFPTQTHGSGMNAFDFTNNPLFKSEDTLQNIVGKILFGAQGSAISSEAHQLFNPLKALAKQIGQAGGADESTKLNPSSDATRLIQMAAKGFAGGQDLFNSSALSDGVTMAKDVQAFIKKLS
jgi:hypothetical protein